MFRTKIYEANSFVGKVRKTSLKMQLLFFLSNQDGFTSSREIASELKLKNPQQAQLLCRELEEDINECYPNKEFQLIICQVHGFRLDRTQGDLQLLINHYHYSELSYHLLTDLFYQSPIKVQTFCEKHFVSEATARRKVQQVNKNLEPFGLRITMGKLLTLVGSEENIRAYYFLSNLLTYQSVLNLPIEEEQQKTLIDEVSGFIEQLQPTYTKFQIEMIALLFGTQSYRIKQGYTLLNKPATLEHIEEHFFIEKPVSLSNWSVADWEFFLFILYLFNLYVPSEEAYQSSLLPTFQLELNSWTDSFGFFFKNMEKLPNNASTDLIRLFHYSFIFPKDVYLFHLFPLLSIEDLTERYPLHMKRFEHFFTAFIYTYPHFDTLHFQTNSLLLTLALAPKDQRKETIYIYLECPLSDAYVAHLKTSIIERVQAKYHVNFVEHASSADLTISTMKHFTMPANPNFLSVHPLLFENDYLLIEDAIQNFFSYDSPENVIDITE